MADSRNVLTPDALTMMDVIARTGSFAAAARELGKVPSSLTYSVLGDYKKVFWKFALGRLRHGDIEGLIGSATIAHHLIVFARAATRGQQSASNYSIRLREASVPAE